VIEAEGFDGQASDLGKLANAVGCIHIATGLLPPVRGGSRDYF
jgi:hypothetical protein